jgi:vacuolar-type H+-ATPase subunit F/Vma7
MSKTKDVVFVADRVSLLAFRPLGIDCVAVDEVMSAGSSLAIQNELRDRCEDAKLVIVSHEARLQLGDDIDAVTNPEGLPLVVDIPGALGSRGDGGTQIRELVIRAMGADLFGDEN